MKIGTRVTVSFLVVFVMSLVVLVGVLGGWLYYSIADQAKQKLLVASETRAKLVSTFIEGQKEMIALTSVASIFRDFLSAKPGTEAYAVAEEKAAKRLERSLSVDPGIMQILILDKNGKVVLSTNKADMGVDKSDNEHFIHGSKEAYLKSVYFSEVMGRYAYALSAPAFDDSGNLLGVVVARMDNKRIDELLADRMGMGKTGEIFLVNRDKYLITPSLFLGTENVLKKKILTQNVDNCFNQEEVDLINSEGASARESLHVGHEAVGDYLDYRDVAVLGTHHYIPGVDWCLITKMDKEELLTPFRTIGMWGILGGILALVIFLVIGRRVSDRITNPLDKLTRIAISFSKGNLKERVRSARSDEIGELSRAFDVMADEVVESRMELDKKVEEQTKDILEKNKAMEDQQGALMNAFEDVEREKEISTKHAADLQKFQLAVENASDHIVITDAQGQILYANKGVEIITGFSQAEVVGKKAGTKDLWGGQMPVEFYQKLWKTIKEEKRPFVGEIKNKRRDGSVYWANSTISPVFGKDNEVVFYVGIERDITKEKEVDRMKTEFISLASHQLRTPLSAMKWFSEMLLNGDAGEISGEQKEFVKNIYDSNDRMIALVNALLNISRIESGRIMVDPKQTDLIKLINQVVGEIKPSMDAKKQVLVISASESLPLVNLDEKMVAEVYKNLITNAVKYSPEGTEITIIISKKGEDVITQVSDSGFGIPVAAQARIFEKFFRADNILKLETDGTGLGLYLVKAIVESSGGKVWFKSEENKGTTFWFSLPISGVRAKKGEVTINS